MIAKQTFGIPNKWLIYIIAAASSIEAVIFIILYALILEDVEWYNDRWDDHDHFWNRWPGSRMKQIEQISYISIAVQCARVVFATILAVGRYQKQLPSLVVFVFCTILGILANLGTGIFAHQHGWTRDLAVASFAVISLHIVYIVIAVKIYQQEKVTSGPYSAHGHISTVPIQVIPTEGNHQQNMASGTSYPSGNMHPVPQPDGNSSANMHSVPQVYGHSPADMHSVPQVYGHSPANMHSVPQVNGHSSANVHPVPQPYGHAQENMHSLPQAYVHSQGNVHAVQPTPPPYYHGHEGGAGLNHPSPTMEKNQTNIYKAF